MSNRIVAWVSFQRILRSFVSTLLGFYLYKSRGLFVRGFLETDDVTVIWCHDNLGKQQHLWGNHKRESQRNQWKFTKYELVELLLFARTDLSLCIVINLIAIDKKKSFNLSVENKNVQYCTLEMFSIGWFHHHNVHRSDAVLVLWSA